MTLKENDLVNTFYYSLPNNGSTEGLNSTTRRYVEAQQCALIAEDFAIGFLNWYFDKGQWITKNLDVKGLLEIYKKDKRL